MEARETITRTLGAVDRGESCDVEAITPMLYDELRRLAASFLRRERIAHTLQPTALANEAWMRLVDGERVKWRGRAQFFSLAARVMRRVLVEHARRRGAQKRGGDRSRVTLTTRMSQHDDPVVDVLALDEALLALAALDGRKAQIVEFRLFAGMSLREVAESLAIGTTTAEDDWYFARAWLRRRLAGEA